MPQSLPPQQPGVAAPGSAQRTQLLGMPALQALPQMGAAASTWGAPGNMVRPSSLPAPNVGGNPAVANMVKALRGPRG